MSNTDEKQKEQEQKDSHDYCAYLGAYCDVAAGVKHDPNWGSKVERYLLARALGIHHFTNRIEPLSRELLLIELKTRTTKAEK